MVSMPSCDAPGALARTASDMTIVPLVELPPQTPNSSTAAGEGQQRPPASSAPSQHLSALSTVATARRSGHQYRFQKRRLAGKAVRPIAESMC